MAEAFAQAYASLTWDAIYASPMLRTCQTADALCRLTGARAHIEDGLKEIDYGEWEGLRHADVKQRWPEAFEYWAHDVASAIARICQRNLGTRKEPDPVDLDASRIVP